MLKVYNKVFSKPIYNFLSRLPTIMTSPIAYIYHHLYSAFHKNQLILITVWSIFLPFIM